MKSNRFLSLVLAIVLMASLFTGFAGTASADNEIINYSVKSGDYLYKICKNNGLTYASCKEAIKLLNGFTSETQLNRIYAGQVIKLPASDALAATVKTQVVIGTSSSSGSSSGTSSTSSTGDTVSYYLVPHTVISGETLASICTAVGSNYSTYANTILTINGIRSVTRLYAGKTIYIPVASKPASGTYYSVVAHKVVSGDTLTSVCNSYGMNYSSNTTLIQGLNDGVNLNSIKVGQTIYIPTTKTVSSGSSTSGSGSTSATSYDISFVVNNSGVDSGSPYATVNGSVVTKAVSGATVIANGGSTTSSVMSIVKVQRTDTKATISVNSDNNSFTMPACSVIVTVKYSKGYAINKDSDSHGSFETYVNDDVASFAAAGKKVVVKASPNSGYVVKSVSVNSGAVTVSKDGTNSYYFTMPEGIAKVSVTFEEAKYYNINLYYDVGFSKTTSTIGKAVCKVDGVAVGTSGVAEGTVVTIEATPSSGYAISAVYVGSTANVATNISTNVWSFEMPSGNAKVAVIYERSEAFNLSHDITESYFGFLKFYVKDSYGNYVEAQSANVGHKVYFSINSAAWWKITLNSILCANGTATVSYSNPTDSCPYYSFTMPSSSVTVYTNKVEDKTNKFGVYPDTGSEAYATYAKEGSVLVANTYFAKDQTVVLKAANRVGYTAKYYIRYGNEGSNNYQELPGGEVKMLEGGIAVKVVYVRNGNTASVGAAVENDYGTLRVFSSGAEVANSTSSARADVYIGAGLTFNITPATDGNGNEYELCSVKVVVDGTEMEDITSTYQSGYTLPESYDSKEVTFKAYLKSVDEHDITACSSDDNNGSCTVDKSSAKANDTITVTATPKSGYRLESITVNGNIISGTSFTMPNEDAKVVATFVEDVYTVSVPATVDKVERVFIADNTEYADYAAAKAYVHADVPATVEKDGKVFMLIQTQTDVKTVNVAVGSTNYTISKTTDVDSSAALAGYQWHVIIDGINSDITPVITVS